MDDDEAVVTLRALAQPHRLRVFRAIVAAGRWGTTPSAIAAELDLAKNVLTFHLKELAHADLVSVEQSGRNWIYRANTDLVSSLAAFVEQIAAR
jgi:ArsR family transcriptional regulator, arsenate/arsenite/antimonite-responsive transcriptional repressor